MDALKVHLELQEDRDAWKQEFENAMKISNGYFKTHEDFMLSLCKILKVPYEETSEEDILTIIKNLIDSER